MCRPDDSMRWREGEDCHSQHLTSTCVSKSPSAQMLISVQSMHGVFCFFWFCTSCHTCGNDALLYNNNLVILLLPPVVECFTSHIHHDNVLYILL